MTKKGLYLVVGFLWAGLLGVGAGLAAAAVTAGAAWLYLFGDSAWPGWTNWAIPGAGLVVGLATFAASLAVTRIVAGRQGAPRHERAGDKGGSAVAWGFLALGLAIAVGFAWQQYSRNEQIETARNEIAAAAGYRSLLLSETHRIADIAVESPGGGRDGRAIVTLDGLRAGDYRLDWEVRDNVYQTPLLKNTESLQLAAGRRIVDIALPARGIVDGYRTLLNGTDANIVVDEPFVFEMRLAPILTEHEASRLSASEVRNLANGWSPLIQRSSEEFPVHFFLNGGAPSWE